MARTVALLAAILVVLWVGIRAANPPQPLPASAPATAFSAERAMADIRAIAVRPHPSTSIDNGRVREHLVARLRELGIAPEERRYLIDPEGLATLRRWTGETNPVGEMTDVVGILPGRDHSLPAVALMAHYDTVWGSPGAGDDSVGVATILETLRAIKARGGATRDILVLFTDGEEIGLSGARAFWPSDGLAAHVGVVVNLEARGAGGRATMFETGPDNGGMVGLLARVPASVVASSMAVMAYRMMPNDTDFTPVRKKGLPGFNFAIMGGAAYYHSPLATIDRVDPGSVQDMGDQVLGLVATLAAATPRLPAPAPDAVFFDVAGHGIVQYSSGTGWLVLLGGGLALLGAGAGAMLVGRLRPHDIAHGLVAQLWLLAHAVLGLTVFHLLSGGAHGQYYNRLAQLPRLEALAVLVCLAVLLGFLMLRRWPYRAAGLLPALLLALAGWLLGGPHGLLLGATVVGMLAGWFAPRHGVPLWGGWIGAIGLLWLLAWAMQVKAPMAAWLFAWPALVLAVTALLVAWTDPPLRQPWGAAFAALGAMVVGVALLPIAHLLFLGIGVSLPQAWAALLPILAAAFWPLARIGRPHRLVPLTIGVLLVAAVSVGVQLRTAPVSPTIPAYALDK